MRAAVVGMGAVSPYGASLDALWRGVKNGVSALRPVTRFDASPYRNTLAGEVPDGAAAPEDGAGLAAGYAREAAREAFARAGWSADAPVLVVLGTNFGPMRAAERAFRARREGRPAASLGSFLPGSAAAALRRAVGGPPGADVVVSLSCASGTAALAEALAAFRAGRAERALAGGFDELSETAFAGLSALRAISRDTIRPFDAGRDGAIFSEGAAVFALEREDVFRRRGPDARPAAWLAGAGLTNDAHHMTAPETAGLGVARAMRMALDDAGLAPEAVGHVNLHGTGTPYNDAIETRAIEAVFGARAHAIPCTANKSLFGHAMGAAGALEAAVTVMSLADGVVPPTANLRERDAALGLDVVFGRARVARFDAAMKNAYGLGGANAVAVFTRE